MKRNKVAILKNKDGTVQIILNGVEINRVLDFGYRKNSAADTTELILKLDVNEITEVFKQKGQENGY